MSVSWGLLSITASLVFRSWRDNCSCSAVPIMWVWFLLAAFSTAWIELFSIFTLSSNNEKWLSQYDLSLSRPARQRILQWEKSDHIIVDTTASEHVWTLFYGFLTSARIAQLPTLQQCNKVTSCSLCLRAIANCNSNATYYVMIIFTENERPPQVNVLLLP